MNSFGYFLLSEHLHAVVAIVIVQGKSKNRVWQQRPKAGRATVCEPCLLQLLFLPKSVRIFQTARARNIDLAVQPLDLCWTYNQFERGV